MHDHRLLGGRTSRALSSACQKVGLDDSQARLMRLHSNTVVHLPNENTVARLAIEDAAEGVAASLAVTEELARQGFPTVRPKTDQVVCAEGLVVSFWVHIENTPAPAAPGELAGLLDALHAADTADVPLPRMVSPLRGVERAVRLHPMAFDEPDRSWLAAEVARCEGLWSGMSFELPQGLIHGDAHPNNLLHTRNGAILGDWDNVAHGPREWDLVQELYFARRFPSSSDDLDTAASRYGWDIRDWQGVEDLISIREVSGLGAYIQTSAIKPRARVELAYRIGTLRNHQTSARWRSPSTL